MFDACSPGVEVKARSGDVDDQTNQVRLPRLVPCSHFYTRAWRVYRGIQCACTYQIPSKAMLDVLSIQRPILGSGMVKSGFQYPGLIVWGMYECKKFK